MSYKNKQILTNVIFVAQLLTCLIGILCTIYSYITIALVLVIVATLLTAGLSAINSR